jgi:hypothetical protein
MHYPISKALYVVIFKCVTYCAEQNDKKAIDYLLNSEHLGKFSHEEEQYAIGVIASCYMKKASYATPLKKRKKILEKLKKINNTLYFLQKNKVIN